MHDSFTLVFVEVLTCLQVKYSRKLVVYVNEYSVAFDGIELGC